MGLVDRIIEHFPDIRRGGVQSSEITRFIYGGDTHAMLKGVTSYLKPQECVWLLFDNIDKGWPALGAQKEDIAIVRCLLEATRKFQYAIQAGGIEFTGIVFIRKDIYDLLVEQSSDRGKESIANLEWSDTTLMKELVRRRFEGGELEGSFEQIWEKLFTLHVAGQNSFEYVLERTFMRPRDVLNFLRKAIQIAVSRGHHRVDEDDIKAAEGAVSEDMLHELRYEIRDVFAQYPNMPHAFFGQETHLSYNDIWLILSEAGVKESEINSALDALLWFSFLGIVRIDEERYSYQLLYDVSKLKSMADFSNPDSKRYSVHPAFRSALETI